jgi:exopolysaccharide biosynthesis protein
MKDFARKFEEQGAKFAINVDGGSSTMFIENGESLWNSKRSAVPVILSW